MQIPFRTTPSAQEALNTLGRTEDVRFSPENKRLAIACYKKNRISLFGFERSPQPFLSGPLEISSPHLDQPHGIDFIDENTLVVANRSGNVVIFQLPERTDGEAEVVRILEKAETTFIKNPGSVAVTRTEDNEFHILICNNYVHTISRHRLRKEHRYELLSNDLLLQSRLNIPDGIAASRNNRWLAVSNHGLYCVYIYENRAGLGPNSAPTGILRQVRYPHGLRFSSDGSTLVVADAGSPFIYLYRSPTHGWTGVHHPTAAIRVLDQETFQKGHSNPQEGGPKGLDICNQDQLLVVTNEQQPLAFFDFSAMLQPAEQQSPEQARLRDEEQVAVELYVQDQVRQELDAVYGSLSWRVTAPLRALAEAWDSFRRKRGS